MENELTFGTRALISTAVMLSLAVGTAAAIKRTAGVTDQWSSTGAVIEVHSKRIGDWQIDGMLKSGNTCKIEVPIGSGGGTLILIGRSPDGTVEARWNAPGVDKSGECPRNQAISFRQETISRLANDAILENGMSGAN